MNVQAYLAFSGDCQKALNFYADCFDAEIINKQQEHSLFHMKEKLGKTYEVLIEGISKKSDTHFYGRTTYNSAVVFKKGNHKLGEYVMVKIEDCTSATLKGKVI